MDEIDQLKAQISRLKTENQSLSRFAESQRRKFNGAELELEHLRARKKRNKEQMALDRQYLEKMKTENAQLGMDNVYLLEILGKIDAFASDQCNVYRDKAQCKELYELCKTFRGLSFFYLKSPNLKIINAKLNVLQAAVSWQQKFFKSGQEGAQKEQSILYESICKMNQAYIEACI